MNGTNERDAFGYWLSGFVDGEGCFLIEKEQRKHRKKSARCYLKIQLRDDDIEILEAIENYWGKGHTRRVGALKNKYHNSNPSAIYRFFGTKPLHDILIPHFEKYPLRSKKAKDFEIWKEAINLLYDKAHLNGQKERIMHLKKKLEDGRKYLSPTEPSKQ